jgi:hypothetical protein
MQIVNAQNLSIESIQNSIYGENSVRYPMTILEKQIKDADRIYVYSGKVFIRDLESKDYFNTYDLEGSIVYRHKHGENLNSIGLGAKSQFTAYITKFSMELSGDAGILIKIESTYSGKSYYREKLVTFECPVYDLD